MKYLLIGKKGQLGKEFIKTFEKNNYEYLAVGHEELELSDLAQVIKVINEYKPDIVINCSAYNLVDLAEINYELAYKTNAIGPYNLKVAQKEHGFYLINYSTDYVFDGKKKPDLYVEDDIAKPLSQYAKSKYLGEVLVGDNWNKTLVFRVSWVFGEGTQNFVYRFLQLCKNNEIVKISEDEFSIPTYTKTIVDITLKSINIELNGTYHLTNTDFCSRYKYSKKIVELLNLNKNIEPVKMEVFNLPANRPKFSPMSNSKISGILGEKIPHWSESLKDYLKDFKL